MPPMARRAAAFAGAMATVLVLGCTGSDEPDDGETGESTTMSTIERPDGRLVDRLLEGDRIRSARVEP